LFHIPQAKYPGQTQDIQNNVTIVLKEISGNGFLHCF